MTVDKIKLWIMGTLVSVMGSVLLAAVGWLFMDMFGQIRANGQDIAVLKSQVEALKEVTTYNHGHNERLDREFEWKK